MNWFQRMMQGRNGGDQLSMVLIVAALVFSMLGLFGLRLLSLLGWIPLGFAVFRMFSKNVPARRKENAAFLTWWYRVKNWFGSLGKRASESKDYKFFACPNCGQRVRVPKHHGRVRITCPKCGTKFDKKT